MNTSQGGLRVADGGGGPAGSRGRRAARAGLTVALVLGLSVRLAAAEDSAALNAQAQAAHGKRDLGTASGLYKRILGQEPPQEPVEAQRARVLKFAPRLHRVRGEFFPLKDIVAIVHPERPVIGYHLFWEDDLGFPSDNDPCDLEVVWVEYDPATERVVRVAAYWHGRIVATEEAVAEANAQGGRPWIGVEWGFHGSVPWGAVGRVPVVDQILRDHWTRAHAGAKPPLDPLARGWPTRFAGDFAAFTTFAEPYDPRPQLREPGRIYVSRWANATINRYCLRYNFAAKTEWPWLAAR
jgi:hypothetical protein